MPTTARRHISAAYEVVRSAVFMLVAIPISIVCVLCYREEDDDDYE